MAERTAARAAVTPIDVNALLAERPVAGLAAHHPTMRERFGNAIYDLARWGGLGSIAHRMRQQGGLAADFLPGLGDVLALEDAAQDYGKGNYGMAATGLGLAALGLVPGVGDAAAKGVKKGIRAFHSSRADFDRFQPSMHRGASFFASTPARARAGAAAGQNEMFMGTANAYDQDPRPLRTYEVNIDPRHIRGLNYTPEEVEWFATLPDEIIGDDELDRVLKSNPPPKGFMGRDDDVYDPVKIGDRLYKYIKKSEPPSISFEDAYTAGRDVYGRQHPHWGSQTDELRTAERIKNAGMKGWLVNDEAGLSIAVIDPTIIEIVRKYGLAGAVAAGLISQEMAQQMQAQGMGEL